MLTPEASAVLVVARPGEVLAAVQQDGIITEIYADRADGQLKVADICCIRLTHRDDGLGGWFADAGAQQPAFLPISTIPKPLRANLTEGQSLAVKVTAPARGHKGARLTLKNVEQPQALPPHPGVITSPGGALQLALQNRTGWPIWFDHSATRAELTDVAPAASMLAPRPDADWCLAVRQAWRDAISPEVPFTGGSLTIEQTEAATVIDVNGTGDRLTLNLAAARTAAAELRRRNIGGLVMTDFPDMTEKAHRQQVFAAMEQALADDPQPVQLTALDGFSTMRLTRRRMGLSATQTQMARARAPETGWRLSASSRLIDAADEAWLAGEPTPELQPAGLLQEAIAGFFARRS